ncbi:2-hydroxy-7-methoxy-5-methyl-1-naphthoate--CoA ligase [Streptomyces sp. RB5]|uniref:2-hydroxy-7-methoxy-5-methyl-1-naphthoate--CoA ligase n=1 Tax=Streptomyces smaragdinus TaxID=2585196 RepID=A0A7K0CKU5_9ACTN|nr:AMP-binding protein [Streptomyces smaragdinus]MQY14107.1 2-hydroxy-7-methoxy-5-methyl-1-naphthoate--CoA ligase [Streptomyces smaragdinus]
MTRARAGAPAVPGGPAAATAPPADVVRRFRAQGWWRDTTPLHDLYRTAAAAPERPAFVGSRLRLPADRPYATLRYGELAVLTDRFAAALAALGVMPGDPVAYQLPSWWETAVLTLACLRLGAVAVPVLPTVRPHGLHRILAGTRARVCVVPDVWDGFPHAEALAELAPHVPWLRHRVVLGDAAATGAVDFAAHFLHTPHERSAAWRGRPLPADAADRPWLLITVIGLGDRYTGVLHSANTLYANIGAQHDPAGPGRRDGEVFLSALPLTSLASVIYSVCWPLAVGGTGVVQDRWDPEGFSRLISYAGVHQAYAEGAFWSEVPAAPHGSLRLLLSGGRTGTPPELLRTLTDTWSVPVLSVWGTPELGMGSLAVGGEGGRPLPGLEVSAGAAAGPLRVRGPSVCLAVWPLDSAAPRPTWGDGDGWLDTGDLAAADGRGGLRVLARAGERTGAFFLVPAAEIERRLLGHPGVREAAVVAYTDPEHGELPCAVIVPMVAAEPPGPARLREFLAAEGVAEAFVPARFEIVGGLPRDERGAVRYAALRTWLARLRPGAPRRLPD